MLEPPLVSIALCTYNGGLHLVPQLESLVNQTYSNLEIIIIDDCSIDNTYSICSNYALNDSRIKLFRNETNLGFNLNFAKAIKLCKGDFISISDQDDIWCLNKIESMLNQWQKNTLLMHHGYRIFQEEPLPPLYSKPRNAQKCINAKYILLGNFIQGCTIVFKKELVEGNIVFPKNIFYDWLMGVIAFKKGGVQYCNENLIYHRRHTTSAYYSLKKSRKGYLEIQMNNIKYFASNNLLNEEDLIFAKQLLKVYGRLFTNRYSFKSAWWFMQNRKLAYWEKNKKYPFFSNLIESIKRGRGVK